MTDRILITNLIGIAETGLYAVGYQIGNMLNLFGISFQNAYIPWLYNNILEPIQYIKKYLELKIYIQRRRIKYR